MSLITSKENNGAVWYKEGGDTNERYTGIHKKGLATCAWHIDLLMDVVKALENLSFCPICLLKVKCPIWTFSLLPENQFSQNK